MFIDTSRKEIYISGKSLSWWIETYQLPLHVVSASLIRANIREFKKVFNDYYPYGHIRFAGKSCVSSDVFKIVIEENAGIEVASYNEARCAIESGVPAELLDLSGNSKEDFLIEQGIGKNMLIVADSIEEFKLIAMIANRMGGKPRVILRISGFDLGTVTADSMFAAGTWCKFGVNIGLIPDFLQSLSSFHQVNLIGFHTHIGSQISNVEPYLIVLGNMIELGHMLNNTGRKCEIINMGGGYPVSYVAREEWNYILNKIKEGYEYSAKGDTRHLYVWNNSPGGFKIDDDKKIITWEDEKIYTKHPKSKMLEAIFKGNVKVKGKMINSVKALEELGRPDYVIEPGRSIMADTGITLAKVGHVKDIAVYHKMVTLEMGATFYGDALIRKIINRWSIASDFNKKDPIPFEAFVAGNLCFSGDMISKYKIRLQRKPERGDIVMIYDTGAYESHFFASNSNAFPRPARILTDENGKISVIKKRDTYEEMFPL